MTLVYGSFLLPAVVVSTYVASRNLGNAVVYFRRVLLCRFLWYVHTNIRHSEFPLVTRGGGSYDQRNLEDSR